MSIPNLERPITAAPHQVAATHPTSRHLAFSCLLLVLVSIGVSLGACSLITPLDFVGNAPPTDDADAGGTRDGGSDADTLRPDASTVDPCSSCAKNQVCDAGVCTCPPETIACDGSCLESVEAVGYCGACGVTCRKDQSCVDGSCVCGTGETNCPSACVVVDSNPRHCGGCGRSCGEGQLCIEGNCRSSPCDGLCTNPQSLPEGAGGFKVENLGDASRCISVTSYLPVQTSQRIVCWGFDSTRSLSVNGKIVPCRPDSGLPLAPQTVGGWYCIQVGTGGWSYAGILLPTSG